MYVARSNRRARRRRCRACPARGVERAIWYIGLEWYTFTHQPCSSSHPTSGSPVPCVDDSVTACIPAYVRIELATVQSKWLGIHVQV